MPDKKLIRLFLHWCQPRYRGEATDLDLSIGFYDQFWQYVGVCSYYELKFTDDHSKLIAQSAGDLLDAPWPEGATEFVDLHRDQAHAAGIRYAVMVVNSYAGMPFSLLDRAYAGVMFRDDAFGKHFDTRTVRLKFVLAGANGIYLPLILDIKKYSLHFIGWMFITKVSLL